MIDFEAVMSHNRLEAYAEDREQDYIDSFGYDEDDTVEDEDDADDEPNDE